MCSVHDTIEFEKRGIPCAVVITEAFRNACVFQFKGKGMPEHPFVVLPHPISNLSAEEMRTVTLAHVEEVARHLTSG